MLIKFMFIVSKVLIGLTTEEVSLIEGTDLHFNVCISLEGDVDEITAPFAAFMHIYPLDYEFEEGNLRLTHT